jgi:hypothetical protein
MCDALPAVKGRLVYFHFKHVPSLDVLKGAFLAVARNLDRCLRRGRLRIEPRLADAYDMHQEDGRSKEATAHWSARYSARFGSSQSNRETP